MENKRIIQGLILILIVSLTCAAIYAVETAEVSHTDSSNGQGRLYISKSGDVSHVADTITPDFDTDDNVLSVYI